MNHEVDHCNVNHGLTAVGQGFVVLAQSSVLAEPAERPFNDPAFGQYNERVRVRPFDNLDHTFEPLFGDANKLTGVPAIGPDQLQSTEQTDHLCQHVLAAVAILNVSRMNDDRKDQTQCVNDDVSFSPCDFLTRIVTMRPPFRGAAVLIDWLSITAALGVGFFPTLRRTFSRSLS